MCAKASENKVAMALAQLRHELSKPTGIFDPFVTVVALENLVDVARENGDTNAHRYNSIYKQTRSLQQTPQFQSLLLKLVGDKQEMEIAKLIEKSLKHSPVWPVPATPQGQSGPSGFSSPYRYSGVCSHPYNRSTFRCYNCRRVGHFAQNC